MNTLEKLERLIANCCEVVVTSNDHRGIYQTVAQWFEDNHDKARDVPADIKAACIARDSIVEVLVYPDTPIGFMIYIGYDLKSAVDQVYEGFIVEKEGAKS